MGDKDLRFADGVRLALDFEIADQAIARLRPFIRSMARALRQGQGFDEAVRRASRSHPKAASAFELDAAGANLRSTFRLRDAFSFPSERLPSRWRLRLPDSETDVPLSAAMAFDLCGLISSCSGWSTHTGSTASGLDDAAGSLKQALAGQGLLTTAPITNPPGPAPRSGLLRLQHSTIWMGSGTARLLVDPHLRSPYAPDGCDDMGSPARLGAEIDAVLLTHSHGDHLHLPSLLALGAKSTLVVPRVPSASMLCPDLAAVLRGLGCPRVVELGWNDPPLRFGDLLVHALPYYGEQPLRFEAPRHPALRNHGNTYLVRHPDFSAWFLVDSGSDHLGSMVDVADQVARQHGTIDAVVGNLGEFTPYGPLYITGGHYWLALHPEQMQRFHRMSNHVLTLGPAGVAAVCARVQARHFLPYAHWWCRPGRRPAGETGLLQRLQWQLQALAAPTRLQPWKMHQDWHPKPHRG